MSSSEFVSNVMQLEVEFPQNKKEFQKYLKVRFTILCTRTCKLLCDC